MNFFFWHEDVIPKDIACRMKSIIRRMQGGPPPETPLRLEKQRDALLGRGSSDAERRQGHLYKTCEKKKNCFLGRKLGGRNKTYGEGGDLAVHELILGRRTLEPIPGQLQRVARAVDVSEDLDRYPRCRVRGDLVDRSYMMYHLVP